MINDLDVSAIRQRVIEWIEKEEIWERFIQRGELISLQEAKRETGIDESALTAALTEPLIVSGSRNRMQHVGLVAGDWLLSDSEESTRTCLRKFLEVNHFKTWGSPRREIAFSEAGLRAIIRLSESGLLDDFLALKNYFTYYGIDVIAFSPANRQVWVFEIKGWTQVISDFNETIHQILKRLLDISAIRGLHENLKFGCAFPYLWPVPEWKPKLEKIQSLKWNPQSLLEFSSATNVNAVVGSKFLGRFIDGPIRIDELLRRGKIFFLLVKSPSEVQDVLERKFIF